MSFQIIQNSEIQTGEVIDTALLGKVKTNFDDHEESIGTLNVQTAALAAAPSPVIIGTIVHSMLTLTQYQSLAGSGWVLADGGSCVGTAYGQLTGFTTLPDLRGRFLRGKNNGGNLNNPDGDLAVGTFQSDATKKNGLGITDSGHRHIQGEGFFANSSRYGTVDTGINADQASNRAFNSTIGRYTSTTTTGIVLSTGDNETRPKSVTVNIFIKVN